MLTRAWSAAALLLTVGCGGDDGKTVPAGSIVAPGPAPIARLNTTQYINAVEDVLGITPDPSLGFPPDTVVDGFDTNVGNASLSQVRADALFDAAEGVAATLVQDLGPLLACTPIDDACIDRFITEKGRLIYRRALTEAEHQILRDLYDSEPADPVEDRLEQVLTAMLFAPQFLYRPEFTTPDAQGITPLTGPEIATRMSFALWASNPDDTLLDAAEQGTLSTAPGIEQEAERMLADARAVRGMRTFLGGWANVRDLSLISRDTTTYPTFTPELVSAMEEELGHFFDRVIWEQDGGVAELLTSTQTHVNADLAALYGVAHPGDDSWIDATLPPTERSGLLTLAAFLTETSHSVTPSPVQRGQHVRTMLLCQDIPAPPDDVDTSPPEPSDVTTNRERAEQHMADPSCATCHEYMDLIGLGLEHYDAIGAWRDTDSGQPVDATGELLHTEDVDGAFDGAIELAALLADSEQVRQCMSEQVFRYTYGRRPTAADAGLHQIHARSEQHGGAITELMVGALLSDGFRYRDPEPEAP